MSKLRNLLIGAGVAAVGGIGVKMAVDYFRNRGEEEVPPETEEDVEVAAPEEELAYAVVEQSSVQDFLDRSFGNPGRYVPTRPPKIFDYQDQQYMVIWAYDNEKEKNQLLAFEYTDEGRSMKASVGYTEDATDYNITLDGTSFAIEVNGEQITSGQGETDGTDEVDFVLAS
jgi:hypothetical protein